MKIIKAIGSTTVELSLDEYKHIEANAQEFINILDWIPVYDNSEQEEEYITMPHESCFGDCVPKERREDQDGDLPKLKKEDNRDQVLDALDKIIGVTEEDLKEVEKEEVKPEPPKTKEIDNKLKMFENVVTNIPNLALFVKERNINLSNEDDLEELRKKIREIMEEE